MQKKWMKQRRRIMEIIEVGSDLDLPSRVYDYINAYYDSLNVITEVISGKKQQLISSVFIIVILMLASSLCMYSLEHEAQPVVFVI